MASPPKAEITCRRSPRERRRTSFKRAAAPRSNFLQWGNLNHAREEQMRDQVGWLNRNSKCPDEVSQSGGSVTLTGFGKVGLGPAGHFHESVKRRKKPAPARMEVGLSLYELK